MSTSLARLGNFDAALRITKSLEKDEWSSNPRAEIWRITTRRLAWQGNIAAATRSANRIKTKYSRADALFAIAQAYLRSSCKRPDSTS